MATKTIYVSGIIAWAHHLFEPDEFRGAKNWKVDFYPDETSKKVIKDVGIGLKYHSGEYGMYIRPKRPTQKMFPKGLVDFSPPEILDSDGSKWTSDKGLIGNGTEATLKLIVFDTQNGPGHRLEAVRIDKLVEYTRPEETTTEEAPTPTTALQGLPF